MEVPIIELEAASRAAEPPRRAIPAASRAEAREALRAAERTQSNEGRLEALAVLDPAREQRQGGLEPTRLASVLGPGDAPKQQ